VEKKRPGFCGYGWLLALQFVDLPPSLLKLWFSIFSVGWLFQIYVASHWFGMQGKRFKNIFTVTGKLP
jgi:hypothetical protein